MSFNILSLSFETASNGYCTDKPLAERWQAFLKSLYLLKIIDAHYLNLGGKTDDKKIHEKFPSLQRVINTFRFP